MQAWALGQVDGPTFRWAMASSVLHTIGASQHTSTPAAGIGRRSRWRLCKLDRNKQEGIMMRLLLTIVIAAFFANVAVAQTQSSIDPASAYHQNGTTFTSPNESGWVLLKAEELETVFERRDKDSVSNASVRTIKTGSFRTDNERLARFEALKKEDLSKLIRDSIHFNYVRFKRLSCLQYDGIFKPQAPTMPKFEYFNLRGYLCPLPTDPDSAVQMEFSIYSNKRGLTGDLFSLTDEFFQKVEFPKPAVKN